jgi:hypothetical protein
VEQGPSLVGTARHGYNQGWQSVWLFYEEKNATEVTRREIWMDDVQSNVHYKNVQYMSLLELQQQQKKKKIK